MYMPVLKNRTIELAVIKELLNARLSNHTIPLFEIIQLKTRSNSNKTYKEELMEIFEESPHSFFLDIPKLRVTTSTAKSIQEFMTLVNRQKNYALEQLISCHSISGLIPVLSYGAKETVTDSQINSELAILRDNYQCVALRVTPAQFNKIEDLSAIRLSRNDYLILDIDDKIHTNPAFKRIYRDIQAFKKRSSVTSIILNSNRPQELYNKNIIDGEPIEEIDNSLLEMYSMSTYRFDGFGDYASITNTLPSTGGAISPAGIYYSLEGNYFIGYRGRTFSLSEFNDYIAPSIYHSSYWAEYDSSHHANCPGCRKIQEIVKGASGKNQGLWKGISMSHYIYAVDQWLNRS